MIEVRQSEEFAGWLNGLKDGKGRSIIVGRIARMELGNFGDSKSVGGEVSELRVAFGPGYRVYFTVRGSVVVILLCGGDKGSQKRDIAKAKQMVKEI
ncbi:putative addiction module killer protein [Panacagrimonas perspica]|uniref:Putative addiction module killer protein n=1 Tax=Panacagrimonas perspica TaxID=381431 RepID=A0A4V3F5B9_9GAMM|nr:type II toxin-antitoxin system RelE/ParE family toxin [Panacagrimonas perspica]TDU28446.1 putative addiction module killer protein [Panacagrimonas perspica]THD00602.1 addiction module antitoxin RelB [Panacagrimonas perspica]